MCVEKTSRKLSQIHEKHVKPTEENQIRKLSDTAHMLERNHIDKEGFKKVKTVRYKRLLDTYSYSVIFVQTIKKENN